MARNKIVKKSGRPPAPIETYKTKILPSLYLGFNLKRACVIANVPYSTVLDYYHADEAFRAEIDAVKEDTNLHARAKLVQRIKGAGYDHKAVMDWLNNMDEDFKQQKPSTQVNIAGNEMSIKFVAGDS